MSRRHAVFCIVAMTLAFPAGAAAVPAGAVVIGADIWARPRDGAEFVRLPELRALMETFERQPDGQIVVHHGGGDEESLQAEEMRAWLVALGVPGSRVRLEIDPAAEGEVFLEVRAYGGN
jgi:hypothetical protein